MLFRYSIFVLFFCFSILGFSKPTSKYKESEYYSVQKEILNDSPRFTNKVKIRLALDSLSKHNDFNNYYSTLYHHFVEISYHTKYSVQENSAIPKHFHSAMELINKHQLYSDVNSRIIRYMIWYYRSIGDVRGLFGLTDIVEKWSIEIDENIKNDILSTLYYDTLQFNKAVAIYKIIYNRSKIPLQKISFLNNLGLAYKELGEKQLALEYYEKALKKIAELIKDTEQQKIYNYKLTKLINFKKIIEANKQELQNIYVSKEDVLKNYISYSNSYYEQHQEINVDSFYEIARAYSNLKKYKESNLYLETLVRSRERSSLYPNLNLLVKKLRLFNNLKLGNIDLALNDLELDVEIQNDKEKILVHTQYRERDFNKEKFEIHSHELRNKMVLILIFISIISVLIYLFIKVRKKKSIEQKKAKLRQHRISQLKSESDLLLKEANHRIMNSIQLATDMASLEQMTNEGGEFDIRSFQLKMMSIAENHKLLYKRDKNEIYSLQNHFDEIIDLLQNSISFNGDIIVEVIEEGTLKEIEIKYLGLLVIELIINSVKYSLKSVDKPSINIKLGIENTNNWVLNFRDNGVFNYQKFNEENKFSRSLSVLLIQALSAEYEISNFAFFNILVRIK